jgi:hypothetical protein
MFYSYTGDNMDFGTHTRRLIYTNIHTKIHSLSSTQTPTNYTHTLWHIHTHADIHTVVQIHTSAHTYTHTHMYHSTEIRRYTPTYTQNSTNDTHTNTHTHIYRDTQIHNDTCTHIHIHTWMCM